MKESFSWLGSKEWANQHLRYGISILKGTSGMVATKDGILQMCLILKQDLKDFGFWWQAWILESWIHRWQRGDFTDPRGSDSSGEEREPHA